MPKALPKIETISIPEEAQPVLLKAQQQLNEIQAQVQSYISGLRHGLSVPDDWQADLSAMAFVSPKSDPEPHATAAD